MRTVVITGCSSGFGLAAAKAFARAGDVVYATVRDRSRADKLAAVAKESDNIRIAELDVCKPATFPAFVNSVIAATGKIDVLVNNAGMLPVGAFEDIDEALLRQVMETNFFGAALLTKAVLPHMRARKSGYVIMISSLSGLAAKAGDSAYSASKFALEGLTEAMRHEVLRWNIKTALVEPAQYATDMFRATASGGVGACSPQSPYYALIRKQQEELRANLSKGKDPAILAELLVEISKSDGSRFRWPADEIAVRVSKAMLAQDDATRDRFLRNVGDVDWWISGAEQPGSK